MLTVLALALLLPVEDDTKLKVGDPAPAFSLPSTSGRTVSLSQFKGKKKVVLAFYPKAFTGGCTKEMSSYRETHAQFQEAGAQVLGVSMDVIETQKRFAEGLKLPFELLADPDGKAAAAYRVKGELFASRTTFVINEDGVIAAIVEGKDAIDPTTALSACRTRKP